MNIYAVYSDSSKKDSVPTIIEQGHSFWAAVLTYAWAFYHKMWLLAILSIIISCFISIFLEQLCFYYICNLSITFIFGFFASDIKEYYATNKGLILQEIIVAKDIESAELEYYNRVSIG